MKVFALLLNLVIFGAVISAGAQSVWQADLGAKIQFYQTTDFGVLLVGSDNSLCGFDGQTGAKLWRRRARNLDETSVTPVPSTDLILISSGEGEKSRVEAVDLFSGETVWRSDKVKGDVLQLAVEPNADLLAVVLVKKAKGKIGEEFKRTPTIHVFSLSNGDELWKKDLDSDVQLMPANFNENAEVPYTLDNYRPPLMLDGRLYLFYEGVTSYDARTGKEGARERFQVNEDGLALTEADPVFDGKYLFTSGRGKIRAVNRSNFKVEWEAKDLGVTPEMAVVGDVLYVRTGGQFTRLKDGEVSSKGAFGISAIDTRTGKILWRFKDADKNTTNFVFASADKIMLADQDDLVTIDARTGKRIAKIKHEIERAQFVLINENGAAVVGGRDEIAAFGMQNSGYKIENSAFESPSSPLSIQNPKSKIQNELWRVKHKAPNRGVLRVVAGIALRATALYFRYGGLATSALNIAGGANAVRAISGLRWSGLKARFGSFDLTTLASSAAKNYAVNRVSVYGIASRNADLLKRMRGFGQIEMPNSANIRGQIIGGAVNRATDSGGEVSENLLDKLDPARQADKLSEYFLRRRRLAEIRGNYMYFYTDLPSPFNRRGLVGVNIQTGKDARYILVSEPDARFTTDEIAGLLYSADGGKLAAFDFLQR